MASPYYEFYCPVKILAGEAALENLPYELTCRSVSHPMVITDKGVSNAGLVDEVMSVFAGTDIAVAARFDEVPPDSSIKVAEDVAQLYRDQGCDGIIAIGGGSVIDTSKGVNILVSEEGEHLSDFSGVGVLKKPLKPFFVVPTTAGTGSEVTMIAVLVDPETGAKMPFASHFLLPDVAFLDARMTRSLPKHITAMTAMDALTHAIEAYIGMAKNPISDAYAFAAIKKISHNLMLVLDQPDDLAIRLELAQASTMAGIAFSNSMVGLVHALGHALGSVCHLPHGLCMNLFLPYALEYNVVTNRVTRSRLGELLLPLAGADVFAITPDERRGLAVIEHLHDMRDELYRRCQLPRTLSETGVVKKEQLLSIAQVALDDGAVLMNPSEVDANDLLLVLNNAWSA